MKNNFHLLEFIISESDVGLRIDKFLGNQQQISTRSRADWLIDKNHVSVNSKPTKSSYKLRLSDIVHVEVPISTPTELTATKMNLDILFEDDELIVLNKPAGLVVHPAAGHTNDTLVNGLMYYTKNLAMKFGENRPGIIHRLDKDTTGILVIAKTDYAQEFISKQFRNRSAHRIYYAICYGVPAKLEGKIQSFLARHPNDRKKYASVKIEGKIITDFNQDLESAKWAVTHYRVLSRNPSGLCYVKLKLETGRTHQIRVHLSENNMPLVSDPIYTPSGKIKSVKGVNNQNILAEATRCALHAAELGFQHPITKENLFFKVDWPDYQQIRNHFFPGINL